MRSHVKLVAAVLLAGASVALAEPYVWRLPAWMSAPHVPADNPMTTEKVELGRHLFYDARLSGDQTVACASCHVQERAFTDGRPVAVGMNGVTGKLNAPAIANTAYLPTLTWANTGIRNHEFQSLIPLFGEHPVEMGAMGKETVIFDRLSRDPYYAEAFEKAFPDQPVPNLYTVTRALAAFQRSIVSFDSPYDRYKYWDEPNAISDAAKRGEGLFFSHRFECYHCHSGVTFSNNIRTSRMPEGEVGYHNTGLYSPYPVNGQGLAEFTGKPEDAGRFRTPSLRNVAVTAPYMHDGSVKTLREAIDHYADAGRAASSKNKDAMIVGFQATEAEINDLVAFLTSLTDQSLLTEPAFSDPWPAGHPARANRVMPQE